MTWDHIGTALDAAMYIGAIALVLWSIHRFHGRLRRAPYAPRAFKAVFAVAAAAAIVWAAYTNMGVPSAEYPGLLDAYDLAPAERKPAMRAVVRQAGPMREIFTFSRHHRDRFLAAGGYCVSILHLGCRPIPPGTEAEGLAIERFGYIGQWGTSWGRAESPS